MEIEVKQTPAERHYASMKKAQIAYVIRKREKLKADGNYVPVGRPRKVKVEVKVEVEKVENGFV